jgi:hypothetical protein
MDALHREGIGGIGNGEGQGCQEITEISRPRTVTPPYTSNDAGIRYILHEEMLHDLGNF